MKENTQIGYAEVEPNGVFDCSYPTSKTRRGRAIERGKIAPTLTCNCENSLLVYEVKDE